MAGEINRRMGDTDALMLRMDADALFRSYIVQVALLDGPVDHDRLRTKVAQGIEKVPRFRQIPVSSPIPGAAPSWEMAADFDLDYHLRRSHLGPRNDLRALLDEAARIGMQAFDPVRPLWESHIVEGLDGGGGAAIQKVHHSMGDGLGLLELVVLFIDLEPEPAETLLLHPDTMAALADPGTRRSGFARLADELRADTRSAWRALAAVPGMLRRLAAQPALEALLAYDAVASMGRILTAGRGQPRSIMTERSIGVRYDVFAMPFGELRAAARSVEGRLNTALLAGVSAGLAEYHQLHGSDDEGFTVAMPVNLREGDAPTLGNHISIARYRAPLLAGSMTERLTAARDLSAAQRNQSGLGLTGALTRALNTIPAPIAVPLFGSVLGASDLVLSSVPGSPIPLYVAGAASVANYGFAPRAGAAVSVTAISHIDEIHLAVNSDPAAIPDPEVFVGCLEAGFEAVRKHA